MLTFKLVTWVIRMEAPYMEKKTKKPNPRQIKCWMMKSEKNQLQKKWYKIKHGN